MRIAAALVTFNRVALLRRAVDAALSQHRPAERLFVINNASTDDTATYLAGLPQDRVTAINLQSNLGGAGGFSMAIDLADHLGFDAVWVFDDDGVPDAGALGALEAAMQRHGLAIANALVTAEDDDTQLAFGLIHETPGFQGEAVWTIADAERDARDGVLRDMANPFNGTLIRTAAVRAVGNVRPEMFIWGDEMDFLRRMIRAGESVATVVAARHQHPRPKPVKKPTRFGVARIPPKGREVYFYRNLAFNLQNHHGTKFSLKEMVRAVLQRAALGEIGDAMRIPMWWGDGLLKTYRLQPSRGRLIAAWHRERARARAQADT